MLDLEKYKADQARARDLGFSYAELSSIIRAVGDISDHGISVGKAIELIREIGLRAADRAVAEERAAVVAHLRERAIHGAGNIVSIEDTCTILADLFERGEHRCEEKP